MGSWAHHAGWGRMLGSSLDESKSPRLAGLPRIRAFCLKSVLSYLETVGCGGSMYLPQHRLYLHIMPEIPVSAGALGSEAGWGKQEEEEEREMQGRRRRRCWEGWVLGRSEERKKKEFKVNQRAAGATGHHCLHFLSLLLLNEELKGIGRRTYFLATSTQEWRSEQARHPSPGLIKSTFTLEFFC